MSGLKKFVWGNVLTGEWHEMERVVMVLPAGKLYDKYINKVLRRWMPKHVTGGREVQGIPIVVYVLGGSLILETGVGEGVEFVAERNGKKIKAVRVEGKVGLYLERLHEIWDELEDIISALEEEQEVG